MPDGGTAVGLIGPNAILQLRQPLADLIGPGAMERLLRETHVEMPSGHEMIAEYDVKEVHLALAKRFPKEAPVIRTLSGTATGAYIRKHRIPKSAALALRLLPASIGERLLTRAIVCHAWTFCGSGTVAARRVKEGIEISIVGNPLVDRSGGPEPQCNWHEAVFRDLYASLIHLDYEVNETACCGAGASACRFLIQRA